MGIYGKKLERSFDIDWLLNADEDCQRMFLRGVSDGDGSIRKIKGNFRIAMTSESFITNLIRFVNEKFCVHYIMTYSSNSRHGKYPKLELRKVDSKNFLDFIYCDFDEYRFLDKYSRYLTIR